MAVIIDNPVILEAPPAGRLRYGLFDAATVTEDLDDRMISAGFSVPGVDCGTARLYDSQCLPSENVAKTFDEGLTYMEALPYWVYSTRQCGVVGTRPAEFSPTVRRRLLGGEQTQVENVLWNGGGLAGMAGLTTAAGTVTVVPSAPGAGAAIAALEESFYSVYGYVGTIHVNQRAYAALAYSELISDAPQQGVLTTPLRSRWSLGAGYDITGPANVAPAAGFVWAFMTPPVLVKRSGIIAQDDPRDFLDRSTNQFMGLAERVYAAVWTCPVVHAVQVPIAAPATATAPAVPV